MNLVYSQNNASFSNKPVMDTITFLINSFKSLAKDQSVQIQIKGALGQEADIIFTDVTMHKDEAAQRN